MFNLLNDSKVQELTFHPTGVGSWEQSQFYWFNGQKACQMYNSETGELQIVNAYGQQIINL